MEACRVSASASARVPDLVCEWVALLPLRSTRPLSRMNRPCVRAVRWTLFAAVVATTVIALSALRSLRIDELVSNEAIAEHFKEGLDVPRAHLADRIPEDPRQRDDIGADQLDRSSICGSRHS